MVALNRFVMRACLARCLAFSPLHGPCCSHQVTSVLEGLAVCEEPGVVYAGSHLHEAPSAIWAEKSRDDSSMSAAAALGVSLQLCKEAE